MLGGIDSPRCSDGLRRRRAEACTCRRTAADAHARARAREHGLRCVLTDSIETAIGRAAVVHTAAALGGAPEAIGLGGRGLSTTSPFSRGFVRADPGLTVCGEKRS